LTSREPGVLDALLIDDLPGVKSLKDLGVPLYVGGGGRSSVELFFQTAMPPAESTRIDVT
jgi:hypothetical protein